MNVRATEICLFRNMEGDKVRNVKFLRDTPAFPTDEKTLLQVLSVETDGEFFPLEEPKLRMEVIGAVYHCISQSGWGVFCSWEGNEQQAIPLYYEQVCGLLNGERNKELGALEKWDFQKFQPDVVVVNLGTNDGSGTRDMEKVEKAVIDFLRKIRACNPESIRDICLTKRQRRYWQKKSGRFLAAARMFLLNEQKIMVNYL